MDNLLPTTQELGLVGRMTEIQDVQAEGAFRLTGSAELGEVDSKEPETEYIHRIDPL